MLQAKLQNGSMIIPATLSKKNRTALKTERPTFYCPSCGEEVIFRAGDKVIAHFAHRTLSACPSGTGGESAYHEQGKLLLYEWLSQQNLNIELEVYLPEIKQRPDFLLYLNNRRIAIEYQCSKISTKEIIERTNGYYENNIHVVWILGEKLLKRLGQQMLKLDSFTQTCIHKFSYTYPASLFYFCPLTSKVIKFQDVSLIRHNLAAGKYTIMALRNINFIDLLSAVYLPRTRLLTAWKKEKYRFRTRRRNRSYGEERAWHQWLYFKKLHIESLAAIIHIPVKGAYLLTVPGWIWQSRVVYEIIAPLKLEQQFTLQQCERLLEKYKLAERNFPLVKYHTNPVKSYLNMLVYLGYIERISPKIFQKKKSIPTYKELRTALDADSAITEKIFMKKQTKYEQFNEVFRYTKYIR